MAEVVMWAKPASDSTWRLQQAMQETVPELGLEMVSTIELLSERLKYPGKNGQVTVLLAGTEDDLEEVLGINGILKETRLILIVPNSSREIVAKGHLLGPRYLSYADGDFRDVAAVLAKMVGAAV
jgi:hypothetical protein